MGDAADDLVLAADEIARRAASGANEYGVRHFGQKPSVRPGLPSRARPTGAPHDEQKRFSSGTAGSASTTDCGVGDRRGRHVGDAGAEVLHAAAGGRRAGASAGSAPARAEPIGVLDELRREARAASRPVRTRPRRTVHVDEAPGAADAGAPQTLQ